jgi:cytochrome P450
LVSARQDGGSLSKDELLATCVLPFFAGHETTVNLIGNGMLALSRTLLADVELDDQQILRTGGSAVLLIGAANRDDAQNLRIRTDSISRVPTPVVTWALYG